MTEGSVMTFSESDRARFMSHVSKRDNGCWIWMGAKHSKKLGYGHFSPFGSAHRVSFEMHKAPIHPGLYVCHVCDEPACVNPAHLFLGSARDNTHDALRKGRLRPPIGEKSATAKLTAADVMLIRASNRSQVSLAAEFGVSQSTVSRIKCGNRWRHLITRREIHHDLA